MATVESSTINPSLVYRLDRLLHRSESSRVYAAYSRASQQSVALKLVSADGAAWTEIGALRQLSAAANVVRLLATYVLEGVLDVSSRAVVRVCGVVGDGGARTPFSNLSRKSICSIFLFAFFFFFFFFFK
jgi:hypothetical protein